MASLFKQPKSRFWWVKFFDPDKPRFNAHGTRVPNRESTGFLHTSPKETRAAIARCAALTARELAAKIDGVPRQASTTWSAWVPAFIKTRYKATTAERYLSAWVTLSLFLQDRKIFSAGQLSRAHCFDYVTWRQQPDPKRGKYKGSHNTALLELKILGIMMEEAIARKLCPADHRPCVKLGIARLDPAVKPEIAPPTIEYIRERIATRPATDREFFHLSFEIARYQGCRLKETALNPMTDVRIWTNDKVKTGEIQFHAKRGKIFTTVLHPELIPLFEKLKAEQRTWTWRTPANRGRQWASGKWFRFLRDIGLKKEFAGICFHSTRVTVVTELYRHNVPENKAKNYVGHSSTTTHRVYQRGTTADLSECVQAIAKPKAV